LAEPHCGAFDEVAPDVFAAWWRAHGASVGRRFGEVIVWDDGTTEGIRPFARRFLKDDGSPDYGDYVRYPTRPGPPVGNDAVGDRSGRQLRWYDAQALQFGHGVIAVGDPALLRLLVHVKTASIRPRRHRRGRPEVRVERVGGVDAASIRPRRHRRGRLKLY